MAIISTAQRSLACQHNTHWHASITDMPLLCLRQPPLCRMQMSKAGSARTCLWQESQTCWTSSAHTTHPPYLVTDCSLVSATHAESSRRMQLNGAGFARTCPWQVSPTCWQSSALLRRSLQRWPTCMRGTSSMGMCEAPTSCSVAALLINEASQLR